MSEYLIKGEKLVRIADAIRERLNETGSIKIDQMPGKIENIASYGDATYLAEVICDKSVQLTNAVPGKRISRINAFLDREPEDGAQVELNITVTTGNLLPPSSMSDYASGDIYNFGELVDIPIFLPEGKYYVSADVCGNGDFAYQILYDTGARETVTGSFDTTEYTTIGHITNGCAVKGITFSYVAAKNICIFAGDSQREYIPYSAPKIITANENCAYNVQTLIGASKYNFALTDSSILVTSNERLTIKYLAYKYNENSLKGFETGKSIEYNTFWDVFQDGGARYSYGSAFSTFWDDKNFRPKYDIVPSSANYMFLRAKISSFDEAQSRGIRIDFSQCIDCEGIFSRAEFVTLPRLDFSNAANLYYTFSGCPKIKTITKMKVKATTLFKDTFNACSQLETLIIEGTIGQNGFNVSWSKKLTHESLISILNALKNQPDIESPKCTLGATNLAKLTEEEKSIATNKGWGLA